MRSFLLILLAGILFGTNASLMTLLQAGSWPFLFAGLGTFGMSSALLVGAAVLGRASGLRWRSLASGSVCWRGLAPIFVSRLSYPLYVVAGAHIHYVVAGIATALLPGLQILTSWLQRRRTPSALPLGPAVVLPCVVGLAGALLCSFAQSAPSGRGYLLLEDPWSAILGLSVAFLAMGAGAGQTYVQRFWSDNGSVLAAGFPSPVMGAAVGDLLLGLSSLVFGRGFLAAGLLLGQHPPGPCYLVGAYAAGLIPGAGVVLWSVGLMGARTLAIHVLLYAEPLFVLLFALGLGVTGDLNVLLLWLSVALVAGSGLVPLWSELRPFLAARWPAVISRAVR